MNDELEQRLKRLEGELANAKKATKVTAANQHNKTRRTRYLMLAGVIVLPLVGLAGWQGYKAYESSLFGRQIPADIRAEARFPVYIPAEGPYRLVGGSMRYMEDVVSYTVKTGTDDFIVTQQKQPADFNISNYLKGEGISGSALSAHDRGDILSGKVLSKDIAVITMDGQVMITATALNPAGQLNARAFADALATP